MCASASPSAPVAQPLDGPWAQRRARDRRRARDHRRGRHVHPGRRRARAQHAARHRRRGRGQLRQDPPVRRVRVRRVRDGAPRHRAGEHRASTASPVGLATCYDLRFPGLFQTARRAAARGDRGAGVVGRRAGQARAVGPAGAGPGAGLDGLRGRLRPGRPVGRRNRATRHRAHRDRRQRGGRPARGGRRPARPCTRAARRRHRPGRSRRRPQGRSRCWPTAASELSSSRSYARNDGHTKGSVSRGRPRRPRRRPAPPRPDRRSVRGCPCRPCWMS